MKRIITLILCALLIGGVIYKLDYLVDTLSNLLYSYPKVVVKEKNIYAKNYNFKYVSTTDNFLPYNYQELINIFYTVLDSGYDTFTFYCPSEYQECLDDVEAISSGKDNDVLSTIGNFVSPFNNFDSVKVKYDTAGEVTIENNKLYKDEDIKKINEKVDEIWKEIVKEDMSQKDIIYAFHDYIINHAKYDELFEQEIKTGKTTHDASRATGLLFEGYATCSGYTDLMAIILNRMGIPNYRVASTSHVWNALKLDDEWYHIDLTWDDPVSEDRTVDTLLHKFYLIDTKKLEEFDISDHTFNKANYLEVR